MNVSIPLVLSLLTGCSAEHDTEFESSWDATLRVEAPPIEGTKLASSSALTLSFSEYTEAPVDHYRAVIDTGETTTAPEPPLTFRGLRSDTTYEVTLTACLDADCSDEGPSVTEEGRTDQETWRIGGTGASIEDAFELVPEGNVQAHALTLGSWAGDDEGLIQMYYLPLRGAEPYGIRVATTAKVPTDFDSASFFVEVDDAGLAETNVEPVPYRFGGTPQGVPIMGDEGVAMRLFMEVTQPDMPVELGYLDSQDALGRDFHPGESTLCDETDYEIGGECELSFIDVVGRQFKMVYPTAQTSLWDEARHTPMFVTMHGEQVEGCSDYLFNAAYVVWDGRNWIVKEEADGCPVLFPAVQAPSPLHLGGTKYKLYFHRNDASEPGDSETNKPFQVIYGDASLTGDPTVLDATDWESSLDGRNIRVEWPNGTPFPNDHETRLDDYSHILPTGDTALQVMYSNISTPDSPVPFIGALQLMNP
jgi:hypothetical protein